MQNKTKDKISVAFLGNSLPMLIFAYIYKKKIIVMSQYWTNLTWLVGPGDSLSTKIYT